MLTRVLWLFLTVSCSAQQSDVGAELSGYYLGRWNKFGTGRAWLFYLDLPDRQGWVYDPFAAQPVTANVEGNEIWFKSNVRGERQYTYAGRFHSGQLCGTLKHENAHHTQVRVFEFCADKLGVDSSARFSSVVSGSPEEADEAGAELILLRAGDQYSGVVTFVGSELALIRGIPLVFAVLREEEGGLILSTTQAGHRVEYLLQISDGTAVLKKWPLNGALKEIMTRAEPAIPVLHETGQ